MSVVCKAFALWGRTAHSPSCSRPCFGHNRTRSVVRRAAQVPDDMKETMAKAMQDPAMQQRMKAMQASSIPCFNDNTRAYMSRSMPVVYHRSCFDPSLDIVSVLVSIQVPLQPASANMPVKDSPPVPGSGTG